MRSAYSNYKETKIRTASQTGLIVMLYDEVIRCIDQTMELLEKRVNPNIKPDVQDIAKIGNYINKAQDILGELMSSLDFEKGGPLAQNLYNLYRFFSNTLTQVNISKTMGDLPEIRKLIASLRDAWSAVDANRPDPQRREVNIAS